MKRIRKLEDEFSEWIGYDNVTSVVDDLDPTRLLEKIASYIRDRDERLRKMIEGLVSEKVLEEAMSQLDAEKDRADRLSGERSELEKENSRLRCEVIRLAEIAREKTGSLMP